MASKKQRRRREKMQRHEWEYVQVDEEGNEIPLEPDELRKPEKSKVVRNGRPATGRSRRPPREVRPPSWQRAVKRAVLFVPFLFIFLSLGKHTPALATRIGVSVLYAAVFVPMFFFVDRMSYRAYLRRLDRSS
jgi:hypothetical protein